MGVPKIFILTSRIFYPITITPCLWNLSSLSDECARQARKKLVLAHAHAQTNKINSETVRTGEDIAIMAGPESKPLFSLVGLVLI